MWENWAIVKAGYLDNNTVMARVEDFGDRLGKTSVYPQFGHMLDMMMKSDPKALVDGLGI